MVDAEIDQALGDREQARQVLNRALQENRERLQGLRLENGSSIEVVHLPMPAPLYYGEYRLPASYANFYVGNAVVLVPTFADPADARALEILGRCFRSRRVVGIDSRDLVWGLGAFHCATQQQPALPRKPS